MIAFVEFERQGEASAIMTKTYQEEIIGVSNVEWTSTHIVFHLKNNGLVAFKADRVISVVVEDT